MDPKEKELSRREVMAIGISAGFALAVLPTAAWAITTPSDGLVTGNVEIPVSGGKLPAYRAMPKGKGPFPIVLVVHEIFGVHAYVQDVCRRLAGKGYLAVAPYLYFRRGDVTTMTDFKKILSDVVSKVPQAEVWSDLDATLAWLKQVPQADLSRTAITGFCWGGNVAWTYAAHNPQLKAAVAWYGQPLVVPPSANEANPPKSPVELAPQLKVPVLGLYGGKDQGIPADTIEKMREALKPGKTGSEIVVYPDADHGFHADYRPSYNEKAAKDGWEKLLAWLAKHGMAASR